MSSNHFVLKVLVGLLLIVIGVLLFKYNIFYLDLVGVSIILFGLIIITYAFNYFEIIKEDAMMNDDSLKFRLNKKLRDDIEKVVSENKGLYLSAGHFVRCAVVKLLREEQKKINRRN